MNCSICSTDEKVSTSTLKCRKCYNREYYKHYQIIKKQELKEYKQIWYSENKERQIKKDKDRYPEIRERKIKAAKCWKDRNPKKVNFYTSKRRADKINRTPIWVNLKEVKSIYENCPTGMTVDHIIPLNGKNVSGLNVPWNLQYLSKHDNYSKINSFDGTYENLNWKNK